MKKRTWKTYALWIAVAEGVGALSGWLSRAGFALYRDGQIVRPPLSPPGVLFPVVWVILYALMGVSAGRVALSPPSRERSRALGVFLLQLAFNFFWPILFFRFQRFDLALVWLAALWVLVLWMLQSFLSIDERTAQLQLPYFLWISYAVYLNWAILRLNR